MSDLDLLVDNDVVIKLAQLDCYDHALEAIGRGREQVGSLGAYSTDRGHPFHAMAGSVPS
ncbi:MAG: hypothetical protein AB7E83_27305 [Ramlibacter sp.]